MALKYFKNQHLRQIAALLVADIIWFGSTNAIEVSPALIIIGFGLMAATIYYLCYGLIGLAGLYGLKVKARRHLAGYMTGLASGLLALQSVGGLGMRDMIVLLPLLMLGYIYSSYTKKQGRNLSG